MKEDKKPFLLFSFSRGKEKEGLMEGGGGLGLGLPIPIGPHKGTGAVERFHIAEPKGSTSVRDRSMSSRPRCIEKYLCTISGSLIRKIELGWGSTM